MSSLQKTKDLVKRSYEIYSQAVEELAIEYYRVFEDNNDVRTIVSDIMKGIETGTIHPWYTLPSTLLSFMQEEQCEDYLQDYFRMFFDCSFSDGTLWNIKPKLEQ